MLLAVLKNDNLVPALNVIVRASKLCPMKLSVVPLATMLVVPEHRPKYDLPDVKVDARLIRQMMQSMSRCQSSPNANLRPYWPLTISKRFSVPFTLVRETIDKPDPAPLPLHPKPPLSVGFAPTA